MADLDVRPREEPCGVVVVGASDKTPWAYWLLRNLTEYRYPGPIWPVNSGQSRVFEWDCLPGVDDVPGTPELVSLLVRADTAVEATETLLGRGARRVLAVSAGFAETGTPAGAELQRRLVDLCAGAGAPLYGPNCVGFASFHEATCAIAEPVPLDVRPGPVSVISQSGAVMSAAMSALSGLGVGLDECWSIGNGAGFDLVAAIERVVRRPTTQVIGCVLEAVPDRERFIAAVEEGSRRGVRFVVFRLGRSARGRAIAQSHTGSVVGADAMTRAWLDSLGILQADTLEEFAAVARISLRLPQPTTGGVFLLSGSGGGSGYAADLAARHGLKLAEVSPGTRRALSSHLPEGALVGNPLDMVGGSPRTRADIYRAVHADPDVSVVVEPYTVHWPDDGEGRRFHRAGMEQLAEATRPDVLTLIATIAHERPSEWVAKYGERTDVLVLPDLENAVRALARFLPAVRTANDTAPSPAGALVVESAGRAMLGTLGLPLVPSAEAVGADGAATAAAALPAPYVVKIDLPNVGHKQRIGGVRVGLPDAEAVRSACRDIERAAREHGVLSESPPAFLVQHMASGPEVLVGLLRDRVSGPVLNIGVGGWAAELGAPAVTLALPASREAISACVHRSGLAGALGGSAVDGLLDVCASLAAQFVDGPLAAFDAVECNPVIVTRSGPLIADVLMIGAARDRGRS